MRNPHPLGKRAKGYSNHGMTKKSSRIPHKGIDYVAPMLY